MPNVTHFYCPTLFWVRFPESQIHQGLKENIPIKNYDDPKEPKKFQNEKYRIPTSQDFLLGKGEEADSRGRLKAAVGRNARVGGRHTTVEFDGVGGGGVKDQHA